MLNKNIWGKTFKNEDGIDEYYPLIAHMLDTSTTAGILFDYWLSDNLKQYLAKSFGESVEETKRYIQLAAGIHDIGKCTPIFQNSMLNPHGTQHDSQKEILESEGMIFPEIDFVLDTRRSENLHRHEKLGFWILSDCQKDTSSEISQSWLKLSALAHHGSFEISYGNPRSTQAKFLNEMIDDKWVNQAKQHLQKIEEACGVTVQKANSKTITNESVILISGLVILADRIASSSKSVKDSHIEQERGNISIYDAAKYVQFRKDFLTSLTKTEVGFAESLNEKDVLGNFSPRGVQKNIPQDKKGLWVVMAPTGAGKTEAALLRHTQESENLIFLLPTKSTTDAIFERLSKIYSEKNAVGTLAHGDAYLNDFYAKHRGFESDGECGTGLIPSGFANYGAKLSAPVTVATIDQMVIAGIPLKWSHLRLLTLANSHIIIDEAHLLDAYQIGLVKEVISFLGNVGARITVLSATMTQSLKKDLVHSYLLDDEIEIFASFPSQEFYPIYNPGEVDFKEYEISTEINETENLIEAHVSWAEKMIAENPKSRLGIFVNTVDRCQKIASELEEKFPNSKIVCLSSRMLGRHRKDTVDYLLEACGTQQGIAESIILVGTQIVEMSLDIDLDLISTDLCPAPSFIQRIGRVWRDKSDEAFEKRYQRISRKYRNIHVNVVSFPFPESSNAKNPFLPYGINVIQRTFSFLSEHPTIMFPYDFQNFVETSKIKMTDYLTIDEDDRSFEEEISQEFFQKMQAKNIKSNILNFLNEDAEIREANLLTNFDIKEDSASTRLIETQFPPIVLLSNDEELQKLGALPTNSSYENFTDKELKAASVSLSYWQNKILEDNDIKKIKIGKSIYGYFSELPDGLKYHKKYGLM